MIQESTSGVATNLLQGPGIDHLLQRGSHWIVPASLGSTSTVVAGSGNVQQRYHYARRARLGSSFGHQDRPRSFLTVE